MERILFIVALFFACTFANAQQITRTDDFKEGESKFGFDATADKKHSVSFDDEYLILTSQKGIYKVGTRFPVRTKDYYKLTYKVLCPKFDANHYFGLVFNFDEENNTGDILYISENKFWIVGADGKQIGKAEKIFLKKGKNVEITVEIEKKGKKLIIAINGMDVINEDLQIRNSYMGFCVNENNTLKVDKVQITQNEEEDE